MVILKDGSKSANERHQAEAFAEHFTEAFGGRTQPIEELATESRQQMPAAIQKHQHVQREPSLIPSEIELKRAYARMNENKAIDEACNGPELFKRAAAELASLYHPLVVKAAMWFRTAFGWKIGQKMPLKKHRFAEKIVEHRDIKLEDPPSKAHGGMLRGPLVAVAERATAESQY